MTTPSAADRLRALTAPRAVALIGASGTPGRLTARPQTFLQKNGYAGVIHPVNPGRAEIMGLPAHARVEDIGAPVDHAYVLLGTDGVEAAVESCARAGIPAISVLADGFAEAGADGRARQERLVAIADEAGMMLIGPNSTGVADTRSGFICTSNAAFAAERLPTGRFAVLSQSGSVIGTILSRGAARGLGYSTFVSVGNEAQSGVAEIGTLLLEDPGTDGFVLFLETMRRPEAFAAFAAAAHRAGKPILAYLVGKSEEGRALSVSHTGALTGGAAALESFLDANGVRRVDTFETLIEAPAALGAVGRAMDGRPRAVTVVSTTGGGGAMVVDQLGARGVSVAGCSAEARSALTAKKIPLGHGKLIDVTLAGTNYETMKAVISTLAADPETGLLVAVIGSSAQFNPELAVKPIVDAARAAPEGAAAVMAMPMPDAPEALALLSEGGVPAFRTVESCAEAVAAALAPARLLRAAADPLPAAVMDRLDHAPAGVMNEVDAAEVFRLLGLAGPDQVVLAPDADAPATLPFAYPVVAKLVSADLPHKTDAGAIRIGLADSAALGAAIAEMRATVAVHAPDARIEGVLVQQMRRGLGEALIGVTRDPLVGPVVTVAMGGTLAEIYRDAAVRPAPVSAETAAEMIDAVKGFALLRGYRGAPKGALGSLATAAAAASRLAAHPRVIEAEINPVLVSADGVTLLDALIRLS